jgi:hypothetical protein
MDVMTPGGQYTLGWISLSETGQATAAPFSLDADPAKAAVKKK